MRTLFSQVFYFVTLRYSQKFSHKVEYKTCAVLCASAYNENTQYCIIHPVNCSNVDTNLIINSIRYGSLANRYQLCIRT